jgi:hypothetical protein
MRKTTLGCIPQSAAIMVMEVLDITIDRWGFSAFSTLTALSGADVEHR